MRYPPFILKYSPYFLKYLRCLLKYSRFIIVPIAIALLLAANRFFAEASRAGSYLGGLPWYGWAGICGFLALAAAAFTFLDAWLESRELKATVEQPLPDAWKTLLTQEFLEKYV